MRVDLPDGQWADVKEPSDLRNGDRKAINRAIPGMHLDPDTNLPIVPANMDDVVYDALLRRVIENWSFPWDVPAKDPEALDRLTLEQADALEAAVKPHMDLLKGTGSAKKNADPTTPGS